MSPSCCVGCALTSIILPCSISMASILIKTDVLQAKGLSSTHSQRSRASIRGLLTTLSTWHSGPILCSLVLWPLGRLGRGPWSTCGTTLQRRPSSLCTVPWTLAPVERPYCLSVLTRGTASQFGVGQGQLFIKTA